jgi:superfamily I DNA/RNA helicase
VSYPRGLIVAVTYRLLRAPAATTAAVPLDDAQRAVTAHREGALLVMGGPGTGKTTTLVEAIAARVDEGVPPDRILALTFGRRMAGRLRDRVEARVARRASAEPLVRTFHAYAFGILRRVAAEFGDPPPRLLTAPEQDLIIRELVAAEPEAWPESLRPALRSRAFATQLRDLLMRCAERGVPADELAALGTVHGRSDWPVAARFMREYVQVLGLRYTTARSGVAYDSAELLRAAAGLLRAEPELLAIERRRLSAVYVDELHDTDPAQLDLLELIAGDGAHLVTFADPDSSTFAFRGADPAGVYQFADRFHASTTYLTRAYRPHPELLRATLRVASRLRGPVKHRLLSAVDSPATEPASAGPGGSAPAQPGAEVHTFRSATSEAAYVAHRLRAAHLIDGVPWSRMAVIVRSTRLALASLQRALHQAGIPTTTHAEDLPLSINPAVTPLLLAMRCALEPERLDEDAAVALLHSPLGGADPMAERRLRQGLRALACRLATAGPRAPCWSTRCATRASWSRSSVAGPSRPGGWPACSAWYRRRPPGRARRPRTRCGRCGKRAAWPTGGPRPVPGVGTGARPLTGTSTRSRCSSTPRHGSPTGCRAPVPRCFSTSCSVRNCRATPGRRSPIAVRPSGSSPPTRPRGWSGTWY